jgi:hypothetical protein
MAQLAIAVDLKIRKDVEHRSEDINIPVQIS